MRLSNVEIFGFKSFLTRVEIPFGRGITSIVGPNGCGKSNIVEAIRWVLGEQRAGAVRGHRMEDVIFSGTRQRKPLGMSEVSLTIDNSSHILPIEFSEVTVTRRLFRSGESDYLLNKVPCRLLDIQNLLMDTGLGPGAYSVMEQGMVDEIISERTENRRRILEEAAGITKYKTRRRSTWNKLESTQADLTRLEDLIGEVKRQVDYLGRQVGRARRYKTLRQEWEQLELLFGRHRFFEIQEQLKPLRQESDELSKRSVSGRTELTTQETELEKRRLAVTTLEKDLQTVGVELTRCVEQLHERERGLVAVRERRGARQQFIRRSTEERDRQQQQLAASRQQREQTLGALADAESRLSSDGGRLQSQEESMAEAEASWQRGQSALEAANARLRTALGDREECGRTVERLQAEAAGLERTREQLASEQSGLGSAQDGLSRDRAAAQQELAGLESRLTAVEGDFAAARERQKEVEEQLRRAVEERGAIQRSLEANAARLQVLEKVRSGFEGHSQGVRNLMLDPERRELFRGVLADLIEVESEYYLAVETALGDALQALVADSEDAAFEAVRSLRDAAGRAGVFPLDWNFPPPPAAAAGDLPGVLGPLSAHVRTGDEIRPLVERLLHNTFLVDGIDSAVAAAARGIAQPVRLVTAAGEGIDFSGCLRGGRTSREEDRSILGRAAEIDRLRREIARDRARLAGSELAISAAESRRRVLNRYSADLGALAEESRERARSCELRLQEIRTESERIDSRSSEVEESSESLAGQFAGLASALESERDRLVELQGEVSGAEAAIGKVEQRLHTAEADRRGASETLGALRVERARAVEQVDSLRRDGLRLDQIGQGHSREIDRLTAEIEQASSDCDQLLSTEKQSDAEVRRLHQLRDQLAKNRDGNQLAWQEALTRSRDLEGEIGKLQKTLSSERERTYQLQLKITELENDAERIRERLQDEVNVEVETQGPVVEEEFDPLGTEERLGLVRRSLERLGTVHVGVIEEYDQQRERYDFLVQQRDDLLAAAEDLRRTLQLIDRTARRMFRETFVEIREKFRETFRRFFPGGEADLVLEPDVDALEAAIEISARPRGKRLQSIALLSGGERALTAIALLFAIYQVKPSPWCILDEVDAPLDDVNIGRFIRVVSEFAESTQFILVTHNKLSMSAADTLHGVTMPEEGVSQMVSVQVEPEAFGEAAG